MKFVRLVAISLSLFILAGCGTSTSPAPTTPAPAPAPAPAPEKPKEPIKVTFLQGLEALPFAPIYIAKERGYFEQEGVDAQVTVVAGGADSNAALASGQADFIAGPSSTVAILAEKGMKTLTVQALVDRLTMSLVVRTEVVQTLSLSRSMPVADRLKAMKGLTIGITGPGAATDVYTRQMLASVGLDPEKDVKIVAIGGGPALSTALQKGLIDAFMLSAPIPETLEVGGHGKIIIAAALGDIPELVFPYEVITARADWAEKNPDAVRGVARALGRANNYMLKDPAGAIAVLKKSFPKVADDVLKTSIDNLLPAVPKDGKMTQKGWDVMVQGMKDSKQITIDFKAEEGVYWTNKYLDELQGMAD